MALAVLRSQLDKRITLYGLHKAGYLHMPSRSAAQSVIIITEQKEKSSVQSVSSLLGISFNFFHPFFPFLSPPIKIRRIWHHKSNCWLDTAEQFNWKLSHSEMLSHTGVWIQWPLSLIVFIPDNSHVLQPCPTSPSSTYSVNNEYFICFGDNESRGESETTLTLFCQFRKQFFYGRILNIFGGIIVLSVKMKIFMVSLL